MKITKAHAEEFLRQDLKKAEDAVNRYCAHFQLNQNQFDALVSFTFNCGEKNLNKLLHSESGNENSPLKELPEHMPYYRLDATKNVSAGLVKRREAEVALFHTPINNENIVLPPVFYPYGTNIGGKAVWTFTDENLTNHVGNDVVTSGQNITVIGENEKALHITYKNFVGETLDRWLPKDYPAQYQTWEATSTSYKAAFTDETLSNRIGNEAVYSGDKITVLDERDNSYLVRYPSQIGYKDCWVSKSGIVPYVEPQIDPIEKNVIEKLDRYADGSMGNYWKVNTKWTGGYQCRGFAQKLYSKIFGVGSITGYANNNYSASSFPGSYEAGRLFDFGTSDTDSVRRLFTENARPRAFVQMGRRNSLNSDGTAPGPHSAIVHKIDSDGVWFYEANARGTELITDMKYT